MANEELTIDTPEGIRAYMQGTFRGIRGVHVIRNSKGEAQMAVLSEAERRSGSNKGEDRPMESDSDGNLLVSQGMPPGVEMSRLGSGWSAIATAAIAALVVRPGTAAAFTLWNGEAAGGKSYVIDRLFTHNLVSTAAIHRFGIWACVHPPGMAAPGIDIARSATNLTGNTGKTYNGQGQVGVAETVVDNGWYPWGNGGEITVTNLTPGSHADVEVGGRLIIPPSGGISLHVVAGVVGDTFVSGLSWYEVLLDLN